MISLFPLSARAVRLALGNREQEELSALPLSHSLTLSLTRGKWSLPVSREQFLDCLGKSGLMSAGEVAALATEKRSSDGQSFASELVKQKKLTPYQASVLAQGHFKGLVFGDYKVLDKVGEGGMSFVYLATDVATNHRYAIKVLSSALSQDETAMARLKREASLGMRLEHPNICHIIRLGETEDGLVYVVMPFVEGEILSDRNQHIVAREVLVRLTGGNELAAPLGIVLGLHFFEGDAGQLAVLERKFLRHEVIVDRDALVHRVFLFPGRRLHLLKA